MAYIVGRPEPVKFRVTCLPGEEEQLILAKKVLDRSGVREIEEKDLELNFTVVPEPLEKHRDRLKKLWKESFGASP